MAADVIETLKSKEIETNKLLVRTSFDPSTSDGAALGSTSLQWSDLFLAEGGVINWDNGDVTITHTADTLTVEGGNLVAGTGVFIQGSVSAAVTASTTQTQGNGALTSEINNISVCANANDVVTLPAAVAGRQCVIMNNGAQTLQIFPASGDNLGAGVDTSATLAAASNRRYVAYDGTNWEIV